MSKKMFLLGLSIVLSLTLAWPRLGDAQTRLGRGARPANQDGPQQQGPASGFAAPSYNTSLDQAIESHFAQKKLPGLVVLYARDGMLVYKKNLGFADVASQTKVNENHVFRLASVSKLLAVC